MADHSLQVTLLEGHCHDVLQGLVVLEAHLRIRLDSGGSEQSVSNGYTGLGSAWKHVCTRMCAGRATSEAPGGGGPYQVASH